MSGDPSAATAEWLTDLDEATCWQLLSTCEIGRLAWVHSGRPMVVPVNYRVLDRTIAIRTSAYGLLAREIEDQAVALEVDRIDEVGHAGWSVVVAGSASFGYGAAQDPAQDPQPWPRGVRVLRIVIRPTEVTGRRLA